jgi:hypothetical protein
MNLQYKLVRPKKQQISLSCSSGSLVMNDLDLGVGYVLYSFHA